MLNFIDHLPICSFYVEALADDDEMAAVLLQAQQDDSAPAAPRLAEWTAERDELSRLVDRISDLIAVTAGLHGQRVNLPPRPRPVTAIDRARTAKDRATHRSLVARLTPKPPT